MDVGHRPWWARALPWLAIGLLVTVVGTLMLRGRGSVFFLPIVFLPLLIPRRRR